MKTDLSPAAEKAISFARTDSVVGELDLVRMLSALVADEESLPAERLIAIGCRLNELRQHLVTLAPLITYQRKFLLMARETTTDHLESTITGEFLLLTLLNSEPVLRESIEQAGGRLDRLPQPHSHEVVRTEEPEVILKVAEQIPVRRIADVNANRIREALRVLDDYTRFARNDPSLTEQVKNLRHDFVAVLRDHPEMADLDSRDTTGDVGTVISTTSENMRLDVADVARINFKRLQESLRSLEEYGKIIDPRAAGKIEQIRYRSYTLERDMFVESAIRRRLRESRLYLLVSSNSCRLGLEATIRRAIAGGVSIVQLREKSMDDRNLFTTATQVRAWTLETDTLLIINDRVDVARMVGADGVHLGQDDLSVGEVRKIVPPKMLIGLSTHNADQLATAIRSGADYVGVGPTFPSTTKQFESFAGLDFVRHAMVNSTVPAFAIGGINLETITMAVTSGAKRVAVSAVITQSDQPEIMARRLVEALGDDDALR